MPVKVRVPLQGKYKYRLVKWEGDAPANWKEIETPQAHPQCLEVLEWTRNEPIKTTYKREE
jgi:hypothetical protein